MAVLNSLKFEGLKAEYLKTYIIITSIPSILPQKRQKIHNKIFIFKFS